MGERADCISGVGVHVYYGTAVLTNNLIADNGFYGVYVVSGGNFYINEDARNTIINNANTEIYHLFDGAIYAGLADENNGGQNNIYDEDYPSGGYYICSPDAVNAEKNYWGGTPVVGMFCGNTNYDEYLANEVSKRGSTSGGSLRDRIIAARQELTGSLESVSAEDIARLFYIQGADRKDELGERAATMATIKTVSDARMVFGESASEGLRVAASRSMLVQIRYALESDNLSEAKGLIQRYEPYVAGERDRANLLLMMVPIHEDERNFQEALDAVLTVRAYASEINEDWEFLTVLEDVFISQIEEDGGIAILSPGASKGFLQGYAGNDNTEALPSEFSLSQPYSNPFNPSVTFNFSLSNPSQVEMTAYDLLGRRVAVLAQGEYESGSHTVTFDASNLSSGSYVIRFEAYNQDGVRHSATRQMLLQK